MLYSELVHQVNNDASLHAQLKRLYEFYLQQGMTLSADTVENVLDPLIWQPLNLVAYESTESSWLIQPNDLFANYVLNAKVPDFAERLLVELAELRQIYEQATERPNDLFSTNIMRLHDRILELILKHVHETTGSDFSIWIDELANESNHQIQFEFLEAYCEVADQLLLSGQSIINACRRFLSWRDGAAESNVNKLLVRYARNDYGAATSLLRSIIDSDDRFIQSSLLRGLLEGDSEQCWPVIEELYQESKHQAFIMNALPSLPIPDSTIGWKVLNLLLSYDRMVEANRMTMPFSLTRVVDRVEFIDTDFIQKCYDELNELAQIEDLKIVKYVLSALRVSVEKHPQQSVKVLLALLVNPVMTHEHIGKLNYHPSFDDVLHYVTDIDLVFEFFEEYARRYAIHFKHDTFHSTIYSSYMRQTTTSAFREKLLNCLVHDEGAIRMLGNGILDYFYHYNNPFEFHQDISQLPPIIQYKLWMSILLLYRRPKSTIPLVLPLLKSNESIVAEALFCKLEEMTECYHNEALQVVEDYIAQQAPDDTYLASALTRLKLHYAEFCSQLDKKREILEFHPAICQTAIFNRFNEIHRYKLNERMNTVMEESGGLISLFKKVVLAKGGGWKHSKREEISKLGQFQSSFTWPRLHLVDPERFDLQHRRNRSADWTSDKTDFLEWITE
ncbi:hypothetical protein IC229_29830 [Spirosoma sp. BT702]|uniref:Uncharacterized protein n=1 Tax=Spirosoma profusum TaxID=2771354 RepID=A0A927AUX6_9BACT|nr:hypothetical protein [Spirosoma profusum]MBD2704869.1 hypothetical protein [Spirosoma profusum]